MWFWLHDHLVYRSRCSNPRLFDCEPSLVSTRPQLLLFYNFTFQKTKKISLDLQTKKLKKPDKNCCCLKGILMNSPSAKVGNKVFSLSSLFWFLQSFFWSQSYKSNLVFKTTKLKSGGALLQLGSTTVLLWSKLW